MVDSTLDELAAVRPRCRPTTFKQSAAAKAAKTNAMDNNLHVMDVSVETIVALQADLSAKSKELLWKTVLLTKLELTLQHADARAAESQVELDRAFVEHAKQTLLVEELDTQLKAMTEANQAMQNELVQAQTDRKTLTERCMTLTRQVEKEQASREQSDAECIAWRQKCSALDLERAKLIHSHQQELMACRRQLDDAQFELHQLACRTTSPSSAAVNAPTSSCSTQTTFHWDELEMERMRQARQQDLLTIAALNQSLSLHEAQTTALEASKASLEESWKELRDKAKTWKGLVALAFRRNKAMRQEHAHAIFERERLVESKRVFAKEYLHVMTQLQTLQETLVQANRQLEQDQVLLNESRKREKSLGRTLRTREARARELLVTLQSTQSKLDKIQQVHDKTKAHSKHLATQSIHYHAAFQKEKAEHEQALKEIEEFRTALIACCQSVVSLETIQPPSTNWSLEHLRAVTGIAEPLVFG